MLAIVAAMEHEISLVKKKMDIDTEIYLKPAVIYHGYLGAVETLLVRSGIGAKAMEQAIAYCCAHYTLTRIVNIGYAGGTHPQLYLGDLVIPQRIIDSETQESWETDATLNQEVVRFCEDQQLRYHQGTVACVPNTIESPHEKAYLGTQFEANAIDMESAAIARAAKTHQIPFVMIRAIVDPLDMELPHIPNAVIAKGTIRPLLMASHLLRHPRQLWQMPRLHYASTRARNATTEACLGVCARLG